MLNITLTK